MKTRILPFLISVFTIPALLVVFAGAALGQGWVPLYEDPPPAPMAAGTHAWNFTTHTLQGQKLTLRSLRGHVTIIDFWATWCGPCRMSIPGLEAIYKQYRAKGVRVVGISVDTDTASLVRPFVKHEHMTYTVALDPKRNEAAENHYNAGILPSVFIIDPKGVVRWSATGYNPILDHVIKAKLNKLLSEKA